MTKATDEWVNHGKSGPLIGTFPYVALSGRAAEVEVYWINDPDFVGLRYPDNGRLAPGAGWLHYRDQMVQRKFNELRTKWLTIHDPERLKEERKAEAKKKGVKLQLKSRPQNNKPKLQLKRKLQLKSQKPKLKLNLRS